MHENLQRSLQRLSLRSSASASCAVLLGMALLSFFSPYDPTLWNVVPRDLKPSAEHLLGTDSNGQDIFWMARFAVRNSLIIALIAALVSRVIAILVGMVAGYKGGTDRPGADVHRR